MSFQIPMPPEALQSISEALEADTRARLDEFDAELSALETCLVRRLADHRDALVYPVLTLPNEIISEIFLHHVSSFASPLFLGHICRRWREIALATPSLWTAITLLLGDVANGHSRLCLLELWLSRSRSCPLSINFCITPFGSHRDVSSAEFIKAISRHCGRWQHVELMASCHDLRLIHGDMPSLKSLNIIAVEPLRDPSLLPPLPLDAFGRATNLETLVLQVDFNPMLLRLPWGRLTSLTLSHLRVAHELPDILRSMPQIVWCSARIGSSSDTDSMSNTLDVPPLLHLRSLVLISHAVEDDPSSHQQILEKLTLPVLAELHVSEMSFRSKPGVTIRNLLARSRCPVNSLLIQIDNAHLSQAYYRAELPNVGTIEVRLDWKHEYTYELSSEAY